MSRTVWMGGILVALLMAAGFSAGVVTTRTVQATTPLVAEIDGPSQIHCPGDEALYHVRTPQRDPSRLIYTYGVEPRIEGLPQVRREGLKPGYVLAHTRPGKWRLIVAVADPDTGEQVMTSLSFSVPGQQYIPPKPEIPQPDPPGPPIPKPEPEPDPKPAPDPAPTPPAPPPPEPAPPAPSPPNQFSALSADVRGWLAEVTGPDVAKEAAALRREALALAARLRTGDLSSQSGTLLQASVLLAFQAGNKLAVPAEHRETWKQFSTRVGTAAGALLSAGKLSTAGDWADLLQAFADGLG